MPFANFEFRLSTRHPRRSPSPLLFIHQLAAHFSYNIVILAL